MLATSSLRCRRTTSAFTRGSCSSGSTFSIRKGPGMVASRVAVVFVAVVAVVAVVALMVMATPALAQKNVAVQLQDADKLLSSGDVEGAVAALQKIVAASPSVFEARLSLGRALDLAGRHAGARVHLEEALRLASDDEQR